MIFHLILSYHTTYYRGPHLLFLRRRCISQIFFKGILDLRSHLIPLQDIRDSEVVKIWQNTLFKTMLYHIIVGHTILWHSSVSDKHYASALESTVHCLPSVHQEHPRHLSIEFLGPAPKRGDVSKEVVKERDHPVGEDTRRKGMKLEVWSTHQHNFDYLSAGNDVQPDIRLRAVLSNAEA